MRTEVKLFRSFTGAPVHSVDEDGQLSIRVEGARDMEPVSQRDSDFIVEHCSHREFLERLLVLCQSGIVREVWQNTGHGPVYLTDGTEYERMDPCHKVCAWFKFSERAPLGPLLRLGL